MSYNGSGTFNINSTGQPVVAGTVITASAFNALTTDLATGLTTAITKDGQTTTTARITFAQGTRDSTLTASSAVATDASKNLVSVTNTGTGNNVLATSPTITTPTISSLSSASATALTLQSAGTTAITVDTSQNVIVGTGSTTVPLTITKNPSSSSSSLLYLNPSTGTNASVIGFNNSGSGGLNIGRSDSAGAGSGTTITAYDSFVATTGTTGLSFHTNNTRAMYIDSGQNVGIGTASPAYKLNIIEAKTLTPTTGDGQIAIDNSTASQVSAMLFSSQGTRRAQISSGLGGSGNDGYLAFTTRSDSTGFGERMRINASGNLMVGTTSLIGGERFNATQSISDWTIYGNNSYVGTYYGIRMNTSSTRNDTSSLLYDGLDGGTLRFRVYSNGGIANYSANNSNLSDQREKKDIELAGDYLAKICAIPVKTFLFNDQTDTDLNLGVIAQDVQAVCPELVMESNWADKDEEPKMRLSIYQTDLQYALMKSIQELKAINDTQAETINALTARIVALENA
jgi:hypothetical protein